MRQQFVNGLIFTGEEVLVEHGVIVEGPDIIDVVPQDQLGGCENTVDLAGSILVPGFVDLQVNGGGGALFNDDPGEETLRRISTAHQANGTTALLPTLISDSTEKMQKAIRAIEVAIENGSTSILGIHLEGPFLSSHRKGVHNPDYFRKPDPGTIDLISAAQHGKVLLTLAPEKVSPTIIRQLVDKGVIVAAGHSAARYEEVRKAIDAGLSGFTHLFNAMTQLGSREPGVVGAALEDSGTWCGVIADGIHVHWSTLKLALAIKPRGKVFLVSDAMPPVGSATSEFVLNGERISSQNGCCKTANGTLAGSAINLLTAAQNAIRYLDVDWTEATRMASLYPARFLGVDNQYGRIRKGCRADLLQIDPDLNVINSWLSRSSV